MSTQTLAATGTLLRLATAGSVDDGKSTLVGRLLHDTKNILVDQMAALERVSSERGLDAADLALLTDGLRAEREQGITIDVAYRYFATPERSFILADCPGHVQYTRNTVTGASTADVLVLLVDVRKGVLEQTKRHLAVGALLGVPHVLVAVNKMDLVDFAEDRYRAVETQVAELAGELGLRHATTIPVSALQGDNVAERSSAMPWYSGPALLELLTQLPAGSEAADLPFAFPVQYVLRPQQAAVSPEYVEYRGYAGQVAQGRAAVGDEVVILPGGRRTTITGIDLPGRSVDEAITGQSVSLRLADETDVVRGSVIAAVGTPAPVDELDAVVCWLAERPLREGTRVLLKHGAATVQAIVASLDGRLDLQTLAAEAVEEFQLNDIGRIHLRLASPVAVDAYVRSRALGSFLLIDAQSGHTLAAGMVQGDGLEAPGVLGNLRSDQTLWMI